MCERSMWEHQCLYLSSPAKAEVLLLMGLTLFPVAQCSYPDGFNFLLIVLMVSTSLSYFCFSFLLLSFLFLIFRQGPK